MEFTFFDRVFHFFSEERQWQKLYGFLQTYFSLTPALVILLSVLLIYFVLLLYARLNNKRILRQKLHRCGVWVYFFLILQLSVFNRQPGERCLRMMPDAWLAGEEAFHESNIIMSVIDFGYYIPYGIFLACRMEKSKMYFKAIGLAAGTSLMMEVLQYICARGVASPADILANTAGGAMGVFLAVIGRNKRKKRQYGSFNE